MSITPRHLAGSGMVAGFFVALVLATEAVAQAADGRPRFYPDDPLQVEPVTRNVIHPTPCESNVTYFYLANIFDRPGDPETGQRARNVNTIDEVPDGPFFVNRAGRIPLTSALVTRAANTGDGPAPGTWTIVSAKSEGVTAGFTIRDSGGTEWYLKFDPAGWPTMATGSEIVGAKLFWALGYHTTEYHIVHIDPARLVISDQAEVKFHGGGKRRMRQKDLANLIELVARDPDGSMRAVASRAIPGTYVGRLRFDGTRNDDPNDLIPHEHHREWRGLFVFAAWLNHVDVKSGQSSVALVDEGGRRFLRTYLLDWGSILGSAGNRPREDWWGYEPLIEHPGDLAKRAVALGLIVPHWRRIDFYENRAIGRIPSDESSWDPDRWEPLISNAAFRHARADDEFWAAYKLSFITEPIVRAVVAEAQFADSTGAERLIGDILARRRRILETYLPAINPLVDPVLTDESVLTFRNAAVEFAGSPPPRRYRAVWSTFDNLTGVAAPIGATESASPALSAPDLPKADFLQVELSAFGGRPSWEEPVTIHFRRRGGSWELVGLRRM